MSTRIRGYEDAIYLPNFLIGELCGGPWGYGWAIKSQALFFWSVVKLRRVLAWEVGRCMAPGRQRWRTFCAAIGRCVNWRGGTPDSLCCRKHYVALEENKSWRKVQDAFRKWALVERRTPGINEGMLYFSWQYPWGLLDYTGLILLRAKKPNHCPGYRFWSKGLQGEKNPQQRALKR